MADDIVTRLRDAEDNGICEWQVLIDAANEIERLRAALGALAEQDDALEELIYPNDEWLTVYTAAVAIGKEARRG